MRFVEFRVKNFKSIKDSGNVYLPSEDGINILAGQNEAGKTAGLKALRFFEEGNYVDLGDDIRVGAFPSVEVTFLPDDKECNELAQIMSDKVANFFKSEGVVWLRGDEETGDYEKIFYIKPDDEELNDELVRIYDRRNTAQNVDEADEAQTLDDGADSPPDDADEGVREKGRAEIIDEMLGECFNFFRERRPKFVYYSAELENNVLPNEIMVGEIEKNQAVLDFQKVFGVDFAGLFREGVTNQQRRLAEEDIESRASEQLNRYWRQKISGEEEQYKYTISVHENVSDPKKSRVEFYVAQSDKIPLKMTQKSRGFKWFAGFNLRLRAHEEDLDGRGMVLLIDEPGLNLHETGQRDVKTILEEISEGPGMQVIYSSHLPIMLGGAEVEMSRILLVVKDGKGATHFKTVGQSVGDGGAKDALSPIRSALGLVTLNGLQESGKCLLVEGIVDYYYLHAGLGDGYRVIPAAGADQIPNMLGMLIGFGCDPKVLVDGDKKGKDVKNKLEKIYFGGNSNEAKKVVKVLDGANGIEELLSRDDVELVLNDLRIEFDDNKSLIKNVKDAGKLIFAKRFSEIYRKDKTRFSQGLRDRFGEIRDFYDSV